MKIINPKYRLVTKTIGGINFYQVQERFLFFLYFPIMSHGTDNRKMRQWCVFKTQALSLLREEISREKKKQHIELDDTKTTIQYIEDDISLRYLDAQIEQAREL